MCDLPKRGEATFLCHVTYLPQKAGRSLQRGGWGVGVASPSAFAAPDLLHHFATPPSTAATSLAPAGPPRHRHRARTHNHRWPAPAPRCGPRRSHRPRRNQTPVPRTPRQSPACGLSILYQPPRSHRTGRPRTTNNLIDFSLRSSRSWSTKWWPYESRILEPRMEHG